MKRRDFIKGVLIAVPGLYINPLSCFNDSLWTMDAREPCHEPIIFFIGAYGKRVLAQFRRMKTAKPILCQCEHIDINVNSEDRFIEIQDSHNAPDIITKCCQGKNAYFVVDTGNAEDVALTEILCSISRKSSVEKLLCLTPALSNLINPNLFDLTIETVTKDHDTTPQILLTLNNVCFGFKHMGSLMCLKLQLNELITCGNKFRIGTAYRDQSIREVDISNLVKQACSSIANPPNTMDHISFCIIEMAFAEAEPDLTGFDPDHVSVFALLELSNGDSVYSFYDAGLGRNEVKVTVLRSYSEH